MSTVSTIMSAVTNLTSFRVPTIEWSKFGIIKIKHVSKHSKVRTNISYFLTILSIYLTGHAQNVTAVSYHPELPIILTGSEDGSLRIWHANTYRLENSLNYNMERVWCVQALKGRYVSTSSLLET